MDGVRRSRRAHLVRHKQIQLFVQLEEGGEVIVAEQHAQLALPHCLVQAYQSVVRQLRATPLGWSGPVGANASLGDLERLMNRRV